MDTNGKKLINNLSEDYCSFEVSKLLSEKGAEFYNTDRNVWILAKDKDKGEEAYFTCNREELSSHTYIDEETEHNVYHVLAIPTHSLAIKWIRENFKFHIWTDCNQYGDKWKFTINRIDLGDYLDSDDVGEYPFYLSEEEATEAALLYTLKNLI